jgi:hypothetical protein
MDLMNYKEGLEALRRAGCTALEIERLSQFRRAYIENEQEHVVHACITTCLLFYEKTRENGGRREAPGITACLEDCGSMVTRWGNTL